MALALSFMVGFPLRPWHHCTMLHLAAGEEDVAAALPGAKDHLRLPRQRGLTLQRDVDALLQAPHPAMPMT